QVLAHLIEVDEVLDASAGDLPRLVGGVCHTHRHHHRDLVVGRVATTCLERSVVPGVERCDQVHAALGRPLEIHRPHATPPHGEWLLHGFGGERHVGDVVVTAGVAEH